MTKLTVPKLNSQISIPPTFLPLQTQHLTEVWRIEQCAHSHPWTQSMINNLDGRGACHYGLFIEQQLIGYCYAQNIVGEMTLLNVAIDPQFRHQGYGRKLMDNFLLLCQQLKVESVWLEVRESNHNAFHLYESLGFNEIERRFNYYPILGGGKEDAIIMSYLFF